MLVVGTAGHIDHGKSAIVRALTGTDPDRLPEEKSRGMTIDLGFAFRDTAAGDTVAFVDVPGHERFVKNMIAGAGGIDVVMLVIAADDGWMPQSEEHFQITRLLGVERGLVVVNKIDLVEPDWLDLLEQEITEKVSGSFLEDAPVFRVSAVKRDGIDALAAYLESISEAAPGKRDIGKARLYIDRSFIRPGIGSVVTGTLRGGAFQVGQNVAVWPSQKIGKVRTLQSNNRDVDRAAPGQRTAVSFTGIERENLVRGGVVTNRTDLSFFEDNPVLALSVEMLADAAVPLTDRRRILLIAGTTEVEGEVRVFQRENIAPGKQGIAFFKPDSPTCALIGDRIVLRLPTPMVTLGGGQLLDHLPQFPRRKRYGELAYLNDRVGCLLPNLIVSEVRKRLLADREHLLTEAGFSGRNIDGEVQRLLDENILASHGEYVLHPDTVAQVTERVKNIAKDILTDKSHLGGVTVEALGRQLHLPRRTAAAVVEYMTYHGQLTRSGDSYTVSGHGLELKGEIKAAHDEIMRELETIPFEPTLLTKLAERGKAHRQAVKFIVDTGKAYKCGSSFLFAPDIWQQITGFVREKISADSRLQVADLRDRFGFTRKFAIPILEETDRLKITERDGDFRVRGARFDN